MNKTDNPQAPGHANRNDSLACGVVLASILLTIACGVFVAEAGPDSQPKYAQASTEVAND
ncbi:MAG TPA: hypothetical protein VFP44_00285 [Usitatibacter sp.]|nr:hypothetical protein [Usitatibacter sp.]